jgi:EmrB/QacA subfamily drug resistance transporter
MTFLPPAADHSAPHSRSAVLFVVCMAHFLMPFMMSAVGVALPTIGREFNASAMQLGLVETSYVGAASVFLLAMGRLGDIHGRRRIFEIGIVVFTIAAGLISQAWSMESIIVLRLLQGMGGAMIMATTLAIVVAAFPPKERGKALGIAVASVYAGISCGPFLGGALVSAFGWRSVFYLCVPLGMTTLMVSRIRMHDERAEAKGEPFDWRGSLIYAGAIILLIVGATQLNQGIWAWGLLTGGLAGLGLFLVMEARTDFPILNISLLRHNRIFALSNLAALLNYAATFGVTFFLSLYLQFVKGLSPYGAGSVLIIQPITQTILSPFCGRLADRLPAALVATIGMALCAVALAFAAGITAATSIGALLLILAGLGIGFALFSSPNTSVVMGSVEPRHLGVASGLNASMRTLGMMVSMSIITIVFSVYMGGRGVTPESEPAFLQSMQIALLTFCGLCLLGVFCSFGRLRAKGQKTSAARFQY